MELLALSDASKSAMASQSSSFYSSSPSRAFTYSFLLFSTNLFHLSAMASQRQHPGREIESAVCFVALMGATQVNFKYFTGRL